jgi:hypothetical protein
MTLMKLKDCHPSRRNDIQNFVNGIAGYNIVILPKGQEITSFHFTNSRAKHRKAYSAASSATEGATSRTRQDFQSIATCFPPVTFQNFLIRVPDYLQ